MRLKPPEQAVTAVEAGQLRDMLRAVVTDGSAVFLNDGAGNEAAAKTDSAGPILDAFLTGTA